MGFSRHTTRTCPFHREENETSQFTHSSPLLGPSITIPFTLHFRISRLYPASLSYSHHFMSQIRPNLHSGELLSHSRPEHGHQVPSHPPIAATNRYLNGRYFYRHLSSWIIMKSIFVQEGRICLVFAEVIPRLGTTFYIQGNINSTEISDLSRRE